MANIFREVTAKCLINWTPSAIQCYKSGCNCSKCTVIKGLESITPKNCNMKAVVLNLVKIHGAPVIKK